MPDEVQPQSTIATAQEAATFQWDSGKLEPESASRCPAAATGRCCFTPARSPA